MKGDICYLRVRVKDILPWPGSNKAQAAAVVLVSRVGIEDTEVLYYVDPARLIPNHGCT